MREILKPQQNVLIEASGQIYDLENFLAAGGQGEVYRASIAGVPVVLEWYYKQSATPWQRS